MRDYRLWFNSTGQQIWFQVVSGLNLQQQHLFDSWMHAIRREDCLNHEPLSISASFFCHSSWDFFNFLPLHQTSSQFTAKDYFPFYLYPFTAYFYMQRWSKDHYMQLKLGDVSRIEIKNHDVLLPKKLQESLMVTRYKWLFTLVSGLQSLNKLKECVCK